MKQAAPPSEPETLYSSPNHRRPRSWGAVTFEEIEAWRAERNIPKKRMADMLGVTNSTYHNWARGIAVATPNTQERIRRILSDPQPRTPRSNRSDVIRATGEIVSSFLSRQSGAFSIDDLGVLVRRVSRALEEE